MWFAAVIKLFPAQAGVIPVPDLVGARRNPVPRASGGDPGEQYTVRVSARCSPRKRG